MFLAVRDFKLLNTPTRCDAKSNAVMIFEAQDDT